MLRNRCRGVPGQLTDIEARGVIAKGKIGHLGCITKGEPYVRAD
jgi:hypothetical protein